MAIRKLRDALAGIVLLGLYVGTLVTAYSLYSARGSTVPPTQYVAPSTVFNVPR